MAYKYETIRSDRRTLALEISDEAKLIVRAPRRCPNSYIEDFVGQHTAWIDSHIERQRRRIENTPVLSGEEIDALIRRAKAEIPPIVGYYAQQMGLSPTGISITSAKKRFGSCSARNWLRFSYRLMLYPRSAVEYVAVHELAHIAHKNHGREFYALIGSVLPDFRDREALLKK